MICPYYKNKKVKDGFNEIVEALGGKPLTDEEFRSVDLRKLRTGRDFSAMNAAYIFYHRNNGNFIDETPNGKSSILFQTLLDLCDGDRVKAINEKVKVYSDLFLNWFGDWINDSANVSKVVDENGEPLVVYHGTRALEEFNTFDTNNDSNAIYTSDSIRVASTYISDEISDYTGSIINTTGISTEEALDSILYFEKMLNNNEPFDPLNTDYYALNRVLEPLGIKIPSKEKYTQKDLEEYKKLVTNTNIKPKLIGRVDSFVKNLFSSVKYPLIIDAKGQMWNKILYKGKTVSTRDLEKTYRNSNYDGLIIKNVLDYAGGGNVPHTVYIQYASNQIKSAISNVEEIQSIREKAIAKGTFMKAPNGKDTNLTERQWLQVRTKAFKAWFGDWENDPTNASKVVDENGEPLIVYRGDFKGKTQFNPTKPSYNVQGIYIAGNKTFGSNFIKPSFYNNFTEGVLYEVFVNAKNPIYNSRDIEGWNNGKYNTNDSWIYGNFPNGNGELVVRNPNQIKSAVDNNGDFSTEDDNIYHSIISALSYGRDLRVDGAVNLLKSEHIIHTFLNNYYITTTSNGLTDQLRKDRIEFVALKYGLSVEFKDTANATRVVFNAVRGDAITAEEVRDKRAINDVVRLLLKKIPQIRAVESVYIDAKDIPEGVDKRANAFVKNGVVYLVKRRVTKDTAMEEFLHPLVATILFGNVDLFMSLYDDAVKLFPNLHALINKAYTDSRGFSAQDRANELVTQALQRYVREELKGEAKKTMRDYFKKIFAWIADRINRAIEVFGPEKFVDPTQLPKMTLKELAELIALDDTKFLVQYDEDQLYHSITESEEYLSSIRDEITEVMNVAYNAYKRAKNNTARRQKIQNELYATLGKLRRVSAEEALKTSLKYAIANLGVINNPDGKPMTNNTVFGYLYNQSLKKTYHDTEVDAALRKSELMDSGMDESLLKIEHIPATQDSPELWSLTEPFSGITPQQLVDIYKFGIGFYLELAKAMPNMSDPRIDEEIRRDYSTFDGTLDAANNLWKRAAVIVGARQISEIVDRELGLSESRKVRNDVKEVYKDWLTKNMFNGDISRIMSFVGNYGQSDNPIIKMGFHLIQEADTKTLEEINPIQSNLIHLAKKAEKWGRRFSPTWLTIMLEKDRNGVPTGNFVRPLNYGQYEQDLNDFITHLNEEFDDTHGFHYQEDQYGILVRSSDGVPASHEEWIDGKKPPYIEYLERIELWKAGDEDGTPYPRVHRRYSYQYYLERISEPYDGDEDPETIDGPFKHGLSPKTLDRYEYITSNINKYMSLCKDPETGEPVPEKLSYEEALKLDQFLRELELLQNPYNLDGVLKQGDEYQIAMELRAWNRWVGEHLSSLPDFKRFYEEREKIKQKAIEENDSILLSQFDRFNSIWAINPAFLEATFGRFTKSEISPAANKARMLKAGLQNLITFKDKFRRDLSTMEGKINYWVNCQVQDLILAYESGDSDKAFSEMLDNNYYREEALYKDPDGYYLTLDGDRILESDIEDDTKLVTWQQYLIDKYTREALENGVIEGYTDDNNVLRDFSGMNEDEVRRIVEGIFTYTQTYTDRYGVILEKQVPLSIFYTLIPKQKTFLNTKTGYVEPTYGLIPKGRFSETKNAEYRSLLDEEFDQSSNEFELPSMLFYDNSDSYSRIIKDKDLKKLYDSLIDAMKFATRQFSDRNATFNYRLPKMDEFTMGIASRMIRRGFKNTYNDVFDSVTKFLPNDPDVRTDAEIIKMPDGSFCTDIPLKYIGVLDDKTRYTSDIVGSVIMFVHMGLNYKNKQSVLPQLEVFKYNLNENIRDYIQENGKRTEYRKDPRSQKMYESMLNKHVYGNRWSGEKHVQKQSKKEVAAHKAVRFWHRTETLQMLAFNLVSMTAGAIDSTYRIIKESMLNKYMGLDDFFFGVILYIIRLPQMIMNIGNPDANNKITALMHLNGVSKDVREIVKHSNRGKTFKLMSSILMGGFSLLDWNNNCILLTGHYHNIRFYDGGIIPTGFYNRYQFIHAMKNAGVKHSTLFLSMQHSMLRHSLWDAYEFVPFDEADLNIVTKAGWKFMGKGFIRIKPKYEQYVTQKVKTDVRSKTLQRSALMNGMNPDNDIPRYKESLWGMAIGAMRGWLTLQVQHLISGSDDTSVRQFIKEDNPKVNRSVEKTNPSKKKVKLTNRQRAIRMAWNFETGTPQDLILIGLARSFNTLFRLIKYALAGVSGKGWLNFKDTKFSYVEKYAIKDAIVYLGMLYLILRAWIPVDTSAGLSYNKYFANGYGRSDAGVQINISDPIGTAKDTLRYFRDVYIGKEVYKITIDDILFRTIEALLGNTNPYSAWELLSNLTVLKSGFDQQAGIADLGLDALGLTDHDPNEIIKNKSAFKYYTRKERALYKFFGPLKNLHTMFTVGGATSNLQYYEKTYGGIYKLMGYEFQKFGSNKDKKGSSIKKSKKNNRGSSSRGGSSRRGSKRGGSSR